METENENKNNMTKNILLGVVLILIVLTIVYINLNKNNSGRLSADTSARIELKNTEENRQQIISEKSKKFSPAKEIANPSGYINTDGISISENIGKKVILVDFWTYSCINCQRTIPYINSWHEKYSDKGLLIIGVHTPEFDFEKKKGNVIRAVEKFRIKYPVVMDNDFGTWRAYNNQYWPRKYLIDIDGFIVYDHIGEGNYDETERKIQELLEERNTALGMNEEINDEIIQKDFSTDFSRIQSPEVYFGSQRNEYLINGKSGFSGEHDFAMSEKNPILNALYLDGKWNLSEEYAKSLSDNARIIYKYSAKDVNFVAGSDSEIKVYITKDGKPLTKEDAGSDIFIDETGSYAKIKDETLYNLISDADYGTHVIEIKSSSGLMAFTFTFG